MAIREFPRVFNIDTPLNDDDVSGMPTEEVALGSFETIATQTPGGEGAANSIIIHFGDGGDTDGGEFNVDSLGVVTCNKDSIQYEFDLTIRLQRDGNPGVSHVIARMMYADDGVNYSQISGTFGVKIDDADTVWRENFTIRFSPTVGSKLYFEFARDPASSNSGEIGTFQPSGNVSDWNPIPSALLTISKTVIT